MLQLAHQLLREIFDMAAAKSDKLTSHHDMTEQLSIICIIVFRKAGYLLELSDIMKQRCRKEQIPLQIRVLFYIKIAELYNTKRVLQQSAYKSVMYRLRRRMALKC